MLKQRLNGNQLKLIAVISMLLDHIGFVIIGRGILGSMTGAEESYAVWYWIYHLLRMLGRVAFPIYAFLQTEGFFHTKDRKRYLIRLGVFALLSEIPFDLACYSKWFDLSGQNVFVTLFISLLMLQFFQMADEMEADIDPLLRPRQMWKKAGIVLMFAVLALCLHCDYDYIAIVLTAICYHYRMDRGQMCLIGFLWMAVMLGNSLYFLGLALAFLLIYQYNGSRGKELNQLEKYAFYAFYPIHLLVLYGLMPR